MVGRLWLNKCQICHWCASSLLFMPNGSNVLALFMRWASRAFRTESRLLCMSSIGMRRTSLIEWPAWLKWSDTGVVVLSCWWFRIERRCSPKRSLSWRLVSPMYWRWHLLHSMYQVYKIFGVARYGVRDFSSFVGCKKSIVCLTLSKKRTGKAAWVVAFFNSCRWLAGRIFVRQCRMD